MKHYTFVILQGGGVRSPCPTPPPPPHTHSGFAHEKVHFSYFTTQCYHYYCYEVCYSLRLMALQTEESKFPNLLVKNERKPIHVKHLILKHAIKHIVSLHFTIRRNKTLN